MTMVSIVKELTIHVQDVAKFRVMGDNTCVSPGHTSKTVPTQQLLEALETVCDNLKSSLQWQKTRSGSVKWGDVVPEMQQLSVSRSWKDVAKMAKIREAPSPNAQETSKAAKRMSKHLEDYSDCVPRTSKTVRESCPNAEKEMMNVSSSSSNASAISLSPEKE